MDHKPQVIHKASTTEGEVDQTDDRYMRFVASDETVDRYGDVISADGWQLANFRKNPIFLFLHDYAEPIGTVPAIKVEGQRLLAGVRFTAPGVSAMADYCWALVQAKVLRAVSVGFSVESANDYEFIRDDDERVTGYRYLRQELLELSLVTVPANPNALSIARSLNLPDSFISRALPLDASVTKRLSDYRRRLMQTRIAGLHLGPRLAVHPRSTIKGQPP